MAKKVHGVALPGFYYKIAGLSTDWSWYELEGEVFATDDEVVHTTITQMVEEDYDSAEIIEISVLPLEGRTYLYPNDGAPDILFDEGPIPSWLDPFAEPLVDSPVRPISEGITDDIVADIEWLDVGTYTRVYMAQPTVVSEFYDTVDKYRPH